MEPRELSETGSRPRNLSPWAYWMLRLAAMPERPDPCPVDGGRAEVDEWRQRAAARLVDALAPDPAPVPLDVEVLGREERDGYVLERVVFDSEATMSVPALLLVPTERRRPGAGMLAVHGHGPGKEEICAPDGDGNYAHELARRGFVVLAPDLRCFGERADWNPPDRYGCDVNLVAALVAGVDPLAQNVWDLGRALDVLAAQDLVDPARLGVAGFSYGGTLCLYLAARDARVRAAVVSGYFSSHRDAHRVPWNLCGSQVLPGMLGDLDHVDLAALVAPRPLLVETGTEDPLFPVEAARREVERLRGVYETLGAPDALDHDVFDGDHRWNGARAFDFLDRRLGGTGS